MDAVTYPNEAVSEFINKQVIPLRVGSNEQPLSKDFGISWTPALLVLDKNGKEHHRTVGFMEADELIASILLGIGKMHYDANEFEEAINSFETILAKHAGTDSAPESVFLAGVSRYKNTHNALPLKEAYERLLKEYPQSLWTKRAYPYRLL
ncbi:MAG: tetratricopeptide repeat protein [Nitrospirae bacterium]|nr:tetratricopeptide repeat protein [Nitrospirota bacterium]